MTTLDQYCPTLPSTDDEETADATLHRANRADACRSLDQSATHATRLALARWRNGKSATEMQLAAALSASPQERWYVHTRDQLAAWRANGGFANDDAVLA